MQGSLSTRQVNLLNVAALAFALEKFILPDLRLRLKRPISLDQVLCLPELLQKVLVIIPSQGAPIV